MGDDGDRVVVRMYRGVLGDCFLITVWKGGEARVAMIDCGVLQNVQSGAVMVANLPEEVVQSVGAEALAKVEATKDAVRSIEADIVAYLADKGDKLDLLVITHDHYDHVAGFTLPDEENVFLKSSFKIEKLWLSWVENPADPQSQKLAARFSKAREAVALAAEVGRHAIGPLSDALEQVQALAAFIGPVAHPALPAVTAKTKTTTQSIQAMREKLGPNTRFLEPGQVIAPEDGFGLKAYVLAPPRSEPLLFKDLPKGKGEEREVYLTNVDEAAAVAGVALTQLHGMAMAGGMAVDDDQRLAVEDKDILDPLPFARPHARPYPPPEGSENEPRPPGWEALSEAYEDEANAYRSISGDWTEAADALALKLDSDTNNSSLVLAFELPDGRVLLFPGDAQVGNWESWDRQLYPAAPADGARQQTIEEILRRVVFYKVGHHGSHNATARARGLELMTDQRLCAAIPVVEAVAKVQGPGRKTRDKGWKMPFDHLYARLKDKTAKRIVRGDGDPEEERAAFAGAAGVSIRHEDAATGGRWVELTFPL
ncbi:MAG TPA: hypothetical protein VMS43_17045 [Allosphingosinicella sp.]|nr:hypothetical protein [Allosphingosinicella sp.]